jgi:hypothetical protein
MSAAKASFLDQLNLTPQERRIVVGLAVIVFIVLNILMVIPHFKDLRRVKAQLADARDTIVKWNREIVKDQEPNNGYKVQLDQLQRQQGGAIGDKQVQLQRTVSDQAMKTGVNVSEIKPVTAMNTQSNAFYEEQSVRINFECMEAPLINFLVNVGNDPAMIRVRELQLHTADANRYRLKGEAILSANYERQQPKPAPAPAPKTPGAPAKTGPGSPPTPNPKNPPASPPGRKNS